MRPSTVCAVQLHLPMLAENGASSLRAHFTCWNNFFIESCRVQLVLIVHIAACETTFVEEDYQEAIT